MKDSFQSFQRQKGDHISLYLLKKNPDVFIAYFECPPVMKHMAQKAKTCIFTLCVSHLQKLRVFAV